MTLTKVELDLQQRHVVLKAMASLRYNVARFPRKTECLCNTIWPALPIDMNGYQLCGVWMLECDIPPSNCFQVLQQLGEIRKRRRLQHSMTPIGWETRYRIEWSHWGRIGSVEWLWWSPVYAWRVCHLLIQNTLRMKAIRYEWAFIHLQVDVSYQFLLCINRLDGTTGSLISLLNGGGKGSASYLDLSRQGRHFCGSSFMGISGDSLSDSWAISSCSLTTDGSRGGIDGRSWCEKKRR